MSTTTSTTKSTSTGKMDVREYDTSKYSPVTEGFAEILHPKENKVFYNPVQQFNRDLSTLGIRAWSELYSSRGKKRSPSGEQKPFIDVIEALSATGLRAVRYGKEIPLIRRVIANDIDKQAVDSIQMNIEHNKVEATVETSQDDASMLMYKHRTAHGKVHVVDLDPYGSAAPFIDAAVQCVTDGGLLLVTCTDSAIFAGNSYPEKCFAQYGGTTVHNDACKESGLRLVLNMVAQAAARYGRSIEPLASFSIDFYIRCFIRVRQSPLAVKSNHSNTMVVYHCGACNAATPQPLGKVSTRHNTNNIKYSQAVAPSVPSDKCQYCDSLLHVGGPMWGGALHDHAFLDKLLEIRDQEAHKLQTTSFGTLPRVEGMVTVARNELTTPFFFSLPNVCKTVKAPCPPMTVFASALLNAGYSVSETHIERSCLKTDAPWGMVWEVARSWAKREKGEHNYKKNVKDTSPGWRILDKEDPFVEVCFDTHDKALELEKLRKSKLVRHQMNPTEFWGPKSRAG